jgi:hypothetical protein
MKPFFFLLILIAASASAQPPIRISLQPATGSSNPPFSATTLLAQPLSPDEQLSFTLPRHITQYRIIACPVQASQPLPPGQPGRYAPAVSICLLSAYNAEGRRIIIIDTNNDKDFTNETILNADYLQQFQKANEKNIPFITVHNITVYDDQTRSSRSISIGIWPNLFSHAYQPVTDSLSHVEVTIQSLVTAGTNNETSATKGYEFFCINPNPSQVFNKETLIAFRKKEQPRADDFALYNLYQLNEPVQLNGQWFRFAAISSNGSELQLTPYTGAPPATTNRKKLWAEGKLHQQ